MSGGAMKDGTVGGGLRWFDSRGSAVSQKATVVSGLCLGIFLFALESERLPVLAYVDDYNSMPLLTSIACLVVLGACVARLCFRPVRRPARLPWAVAAALSCSVGLADRYLIVPVSEGIQTLLWVLYSVGGPILVFFWVQRAMPLGRAFVVRSFGVGAVALGCLSMLTVAFERPIALGLVFALPFVGVALLPLVGGGAESAGRPSTGRWNAFRAIAGRAGGAGRGGAAAGAASSTADSDAGESLVRSLLKLAPFLCYAVVFGNVHFSWLDLQDGGSVDLWVQFGASTGSIVCGLAAFALVRLHWGRALEDIMSLLLIAVALVALWLSGFVASGGVFAYLVLLNIAQKLTFLMMLLFGFPFARNGSECTSLWALAYFSFFAGTCVSYLSGVYAADSLDIIAAVALAVVFVADIVDIALLYGGDGVRAGTGGENEGADRRMGQKAVLAEGEAAVSVGLASVGPAAKAPRDAERGPGLGGDASVAGAPSAMGAAPAAGASPGAGAEELAYACHLIARQFDLTRREEEILCLLVRGRTATRVAEALCISVATARTHQRNIYAKLGVHNQQDILDLFEEYAQKGGASPDR